MSSMLRALLYRQLLGGSAPRTSRRLADGVALLMVAALLSVPRSGLACSFGGTVTHVLDDEEVEADSMPPGVPGVAARVRWLVPRSSSCGQIESSSCAGIAVLELRIDAPMDDRTPPDELGYLILMDGAENPPYHLPSEPVRASGGQVLLPWILINSNDKGLSGVTIRVSAVDLGGNESDPSPPLGISDGRSAGCVAAPTNLAPLDGPFSMLVFLVALRAMLALGSGARLGYRRQGWTTPTSESSARSNEANDSHPAALARSAMR